MWNLDKCGEHDCIAISAKQYRFKDHYFVVPESLLIGKTNEERSVTVYEEFCRSRDQVEGKK